jgi:hypothetical protein
MATAAPSLNRADLDQTLARVSSKPNVSGALVLSKETGAIIRSTVADNELAKKYCLGVKRAHFAVSRLTVGLLQCSNEITQDIDEDVGLSGRKFLILGRLTVLETAVKEIRVTHCAWYFLDYKEWLICR